MSASNGALSLVHLINGRSANVGNGALTDGVEAILSEDLRRPIKWMREPWDDYTFDVKPFDRDFLSLLHEKADALLGGGAVTFNNRANLKNTGIRLDMPPELWKQVRHPIIFYGASYRHWRGQPLVHADKVKWTLKYILDQEHML